MANKTPSGMKSASLDNGLGNEHRPGSPESTDAYPPMLNGDELLWSLICGAFSSGKEEAEGEPFIKEKAREVKGEAEVREEILRWRYVSIVADEKSHFHTDVAKIK